MRPKTNYFFIEMKFFYFDFLNLKFRRKKGGLFSKFPIKCHEDGKYFIGQIQERYNVTIYYFKVIITFLIIKFIINEILRISIILV